MGENFIKTNINNLQYIPHNMAKKNLAHFIRLGGVRLIRNIAPRSAPLRSAPLLPPTSHANELHPLGMTYKSMKMNLLLYRVSRFARHNNASENMYSHNGQ